MKYFFSIRKVPLIFGCHAPMGCEVESRRLRANKSAVAAEAVSGNLGNVAAGGAGRRADGPGVVGIQGGAGGSRSAAEAPSLEELGGRRSLLCARRAPATLGLCAGSRRRLRFKEAVTDGEGWEVTSAAPPTTRVVFFPDFPENYEK